MVKKELNLSSESYKFVIFDSGVGGIELFSKIKLNFPEFSVFYFSDEENFPYGNKLQEEILKIMLENFEKIAKLQPKYLIIACNTASFIINKYKDKFKYEFELIDMFKFLTKYLNDSDKTILTTNLTSKLLAEFEKKTEIVAMPELAYLIQENQDCESYLKQFDLDNKNIVFGCTHFPLIQNIFEKTYPNSKFFNPIDDIINEMLKKFK